MKYYDIQQNSDEWFELRKGKITASIFKDFFMSKSTKGYKSAINRIVFEKLTGEIPESFSNDYMKRGTELEPEAKEAYKLQTFNKVQNGGFFEYNEWIGASPDGLIGNDGLLEIKCPAYHTMIEYLITKKLPGEYHYQVHGQLLATDRQWCDFVAYHPKLKLYILRVNRDESICQIILDQLNNSIEEIKQKIELLIKI